MKRNTTIREMMNFDDVVLIPSETHVLPSAVNTKTRLTKGISLNIPLISAARDHVTESKMAITIAQLGGIGVIHDGLPIGKQVEEVRRVKRAQAKMALNPITVSPETSVAEALDLMTTYKVSGLPVIESASQKVVGIITARDLRFFEDYAKPVSELMSKDVVTVSEGTTVEDIKKILHEKRVKKIILTNKDQHCTGIMTVRDIQRSGQYPHAAVDKNGSLIVGASVGTGKDSFDRAQSLTDAGVDAIFVDVAHAHQKDVTNLVSRIRQQRSSNVQVIVGNVATADAARSLIDAGADAIKVGIGGWECDALRRLVGVGVPQITAIMDVAEECSMQDVPVIVDGGVNCSASLAKALAAGAESVVISDLFAGTDESPGAVIYRNDMPYKLVQATQGPRLPTQGGGTGDPFELKADLVDTTVPYKGSVVHAANHLIEGLKMAMAYTGSQQVKDLCDRVEIAITK